MKVYKQDSDFHNRVEELFMKMEELNLTITPSYYGHGFVVCDTNLIHQPSKIVETDGTVITTIPSNFEYVLKIEE